MPRLHFATLYTEVIELRTPGEPTEGGQFEMQIFIDTDILRKEPSPRTYFFREIGLHLRRAIEETGVPQEYWWVKFESTPQKEWGLPQRQKLKI